MREAVRSSSLLALLMACPVVAQPDSDKPSPEQAVAAWLSSDFSDREVLDTAIDAVLDGGDDAIVALGKRTRALKAGDHKARRGLNSLISNLCVKFMQRQVESGMVFAGQYDALRALQPWSGQFFVQLVADTPDWFPDDMRPTAVPALRDLYPKQPDGRVLDRLEEIAGDEDFESDTLRRTLSFALAQWGRRKLVDAQLAEIRESIGEGRTADQLSFVRFLADVHYQLRDYDSASKEWQRFIDGTLALEDRPSANDYYNAACCMSLAGAIEKSLAAIEKCANRLAEGPQDSSFKLTRSMFDSDPDLRGVRPTKRFQAAKLKAFGADPDPDKDGD